MNKQAPSPLRILTMVAFALSCFGLLLYLWLAFGGAVPLRSEGYRAFVSFPEATTLATEADVRMSGVNIGKVKAKELDENGVATRVEIEIDAKYAPIPEDTRAILRQKTLLGETYVELTPGSMSADELPEGGTIARSNVESTTELDEIFRLFDDETRDAFGIWIKETARALDDGRGEDLNDAIGNLEPFAQHGATLLETLDLQERAVRSLVRDTGTVFRALSQRDGQLQSLIRNTDDVFEATASRDEALAETFRVFPTFLEESQTTLTRLQRFSNDTRPLVNALKPAADDLDPTVRDVQALAPDLENLFRDLDPLIDASEDNLPALADFLRGAGPVFDGLHPFLQEFNPILSYANFKQTGLSDFFSTGTAALNYRLLSGGGGNSTGHALPLYGAIDSRSMAFFNTTRPPYEIGNAYDEPNFAVRAARVGAIEAFTCPAGERADPDPQIMAPPCVLKPPSLFDGRWYPNVERGRAPNVPYPQGDEGTRPPRIPGR